MHSYINNYNLMYSQNEKLFSDIEKEINGEYSAINCYANLANLTSNGSERKQIFEIR